MLPPPFNQDLYLADNVEVRPVQQLVVKAGVEALAITILPRRCRLDLSRFASTALIQSNGEGDFRDLAA